MATARPPSGQPSLQRIAHVEHVLRQRSMACIQQQQQQQQQQQHQTCCRPTGSQRSRGYSATRTTFERRFFSFFYFATGLGQFQNSFGAHNVRFCILISENYARCRRAKKVRVSRTAVIQLCMAYSIFAYRLLDQRCVAFIFVLGRQDSRAQGRREISVSCSNS